jgi:hypothetical protein
MSNMNNQLTVFKKTITIEGRSAEALIEVNQGINRKGLPFRNVWFVNTSPVLIVDAADKFMDGEIEFSQLIRVMNEGGFFS